MNYNLRSVIFLLLSLPFVINCSSGEDIGSAMSGSSIEFKIVESGFYDGSGASTIKRLEVYRDQESLNNSSSLREFGFNGTNIDFTSKQVVFVTMGQRPSGGFNIDVQSVRDHGGYVQVNLSSTFHGTGCISTTAITHPHKLIEIDSVKEVVFNEVYVLKNCET